ncbi:hypothetical protein FRC09_014081 [Ceratobasidium sp. 395]|nr:hypothetical protein FRC09_014081 [Ceratobasidium sp. 395]
MLHDYERAEALYTLGSAVPFSDLTDRAVYIAVVMQQRIPKRPRRFPSFTPYEAAQLWGIVVDSCAHSSSDRPGSIEIRDHEANRPWTPPTLPDGDERDDEYAEYAEYDEYDEYDEYGEYEDGEDGEDYESDEEGLVQPNSNTTPVVDPYANVQSGTIAYAKSESPDGVATYTPVVAQETFYQTSSGRTRGIKWVKATPSQAMAAGIPSEAITTNNAAELPRPTGISIPPISFLRERRLSVSSVASPGSNRHNDLTPEPWLDPDNPRLGRPNTAADDAAMMAHVRALEEARKLVKGEIDQEDEESMQRESRTPDKYR